jgi:UDP-GlcNAc3NAcA epimerase
VVGARPQFIKAALVSEELKRRGIEEVLVHSGQHYDYAMSQVFFDHLGLPEPRFHLEAGSGSQATQTARIMVRLEPVLEAECPDWVIAFGDTNTTLATALVASKLRIPLAHVEAGLRSFNKAMPEEVNRVVTDHVSDILFAPHEKAAQQLRHEGVIAHVRIVGDLMVDSIVRAVARMTDPAKVLDRFGLAERAYGVATVHRAANTDDPTAFGRIVQGLRKIPLPILFPVHPRTRKLAEHYELGSAGDNIITCDALPYGDMIAVQRYARVIVTDSGGMQKEALVLRVPCVTLRNETEWTETLEGGWNVLAGTDPDLIASLTQRSYPEIPPKNYYGDGRTASAIVDALMCYGRLNHSPTLAGTAAVKGGARHNARS